MRSKYRKCQHLSFIFYTYVNYMKLDEKFSICDFMFSWLDGKQLNHRIKYLHRIRNLQLLHLKCHKLNFKSSFFLPQRNGNFWIVQQTFDFVDVIFIKLCFYTNLITIVFNMKTKVCPEENFVIVWKKAALF